MSTCSSAEGVLEASALVRANSQKLESFVNGEDTQTVQLGTGDPTPVVRKLVKDIKEMFEEAASTITPAGTAVSITSSYIDSLFE